MSNWLNDLQAGDTVQSRTYGLSYIVVANYGNHVTAIRTADITNPDEWVLVQKSAQHDVQLTALRRGWRGRFANWLVSLGNRVAQSGGN